MTATKYARNGPAHIAYQVLSDGPIDLVFMPGTLTPMDMYDEHPTMARFVRRLKSFARLVVMDRRGTGQSDAVGVNEVPDEHEWANDVLAVMDAAGMDKPSILAGFDATIPTVVLAAAHPDRVSSLVIAGGFVKFLAGEDHPWGFDPRASTTYETVVEEGAVSPEFDLLAQVAPSVGKDARFRDWWDRAGRRAAGPATALAIANFMFAVDARPHLSKIAAPTLVIHKKDSLFVNVEEARFIASHIPQSQLIELEGADHLVWVDGEGILDAAEEFLTGTRGDPVDRVLATVLFTDIVDSTRQATSSATAAGASSSTRTTRPVAARSNAAADASSNKPVTDCSQPSPDPVRRSGAQWHSVKTLPGGDHIRAGIHTGEVEVRGDDVGGIAVHIAARVMGEAGPDEIIVSSVVPPLVVGSEIEFADRGPRELKGVPGEWRVLAVEN